MQASMRGLSALFQDHGEGLYLTTWSLVPSITAAWCYILSHLFTMPSILSWLLLLIFPEVSLPSASGVHSVRWFQLKTSVTANNETNQLTVPKVYKQAIQQVCAHLFFRSSSFFLLHLTASPWFLCLLIVPLLSSPRLDPRGDLFSIFSSCSFLLIPSYLRDFIHLMTLFIIFMWKPA